MLMTGLRKARAMSDPAELGWPPVLPMELAMRVDTPRAICEAHNIDRETWDRLRYDPAFIEAVKDAHELLKKEGGAFKIKARIQAEALLQTSWQLIHAPTDEVPPNVRADLIKFTIKAAGLDGSKDQAANAIQQNALSIHIDLG